MKRFLFTLLQVIGYFAAIVVVIILEVKLTKLIVGDVDIDTVDPMLQILFLGFHIVIAAAVTNTVMARVGKSKVVREGWPALRQSIRWFGIGIFVGLIMIGGVLGIILLSGGGRLTLDSGGFTQYLEFVLPLVGCLLIAALGEEWIFRGYPLSRFSQVVGRGWANLIVALIFSAAHWGGNGWTALTAVNILLFSMVNGARGTDLECRW
jgi:membrane protease YdiL (CAAX protease family)